MFTSVRLPSTVTTIGNYAFQNCSGLTDLYVAGEEAIFADSALSGCTALTLHIQPENMALADWCEAHGVAYELTDAGPYMLTLFLNNGEANEDLRFLWNAPLALPEPVWEGHVFSGWYEDPELTRALGFETMPPRHVTLYAGWDINVYTLTLIPNNGEAQQTQRLVWKTPLTLPEPVWEGHVFSGWYEDAALTVKCFGGAMPRADLTLYAGWDIDVYTLTLDAAGGTVETSALRVPGGTEPPLPTPTRAGYAFAGWASDAEGLYPFTGHMPYEALTLFAQWAAYGANGRYRVDGDHATLVEYLRQEEESETVWLPETALGLPLTAIAAGAFEESGVKELHLPDSVTAIETGAFAGSELRALYVDAANPVYRSLSGLIYSRDGSELLFAPPCGSYYVTLPESVRRIAPYAFDASQLREIALNEGLESIGERAFRDTMLTTLALPASLESIGDRAFSGCSSLYCVEAAGSPSTIGEEAFFGCDPFLAAYGPIGDCALSRCFRDAGYRYNAYILTLAFPLQQVKSIREAGTLLELPESADASENLQFTGWYLDAAATEPFTGTAMPAEDLTLYAGTEAVFDYESVVDPDSGETVGLRLTFCRAPGPEISVPAAIGGVPVVSVTAGCFGASFTRVTLPDSLSEIEEGAFAAGTELVCTPGSTADAAAQAAGYTTAERSWTLSWVSGYVVTPEPSVLHAGEPIPAPPTLTRSGYSFVGWYYDEGFTLPLGAQDPMPAQDLCLYASWELADEAAAALAEALLWTTDGESVTITGYTGDATALTIPASLHGYPVTAVAVNAFAFNNAITALILPDTVTSLGERAFFAMRSLESLTLSTGLRTLPAQALESCSALEDLSLPEGLEFISDDALAETGLRTLTLPASLKKIESTALRGCTALEAVEIAAGNSFYESRDGVLYDTADGILVKYPAAKADTSFTVAGVWSVGPWAFEGAQALEHVTLPADLYTLGKGAFFGCAGLTELPLPGSLVSVIPEQCFYGCGGLLAVTLPETVGALGSNAFGASGLEEITVSAALTEIGPMAIGRGVLLRGPSGCYAESWAAANGLDFAATDTVLIENVTLAEAKLDLLRGEQAQLQITLSPAGADASALRYESSNERVARVDEDGRVYAVGGGAATVFVWAPGGVCASCVVNVQVLLEEFWLSCARECVCEAGQSFSLGAKMLPQKVTNPGVIYASSNEAVATVAENGTVTTHQRGAALITATPEADASKAQTILLICGLDNVLLLPAGLTELEEEALADSGAERVVVPATVLSIGNRAFADCGQLYLIEFTSASPAIAEDAFESSEALILVAPAGGTLESYAAAHGILFFPR